MTTVTITAPCRHLCPFVDEVDEGHLTLSWVVVDALLELHQVAAFLRTFAERKISHEALTDELVRYLAQAGVKPISATWRGRTAGMAVTVERVGSDLLCQPINPDSP